MDEQNMFDAPIEFDLDEILMQMMENQEEADFLHNMDLYQSAARQQKKPRMTSFVQGLLDVPIIRKESDFILEHKKFHCNRHKSIQKVLKGLTNVKSIYSFDDPLAELIQMIRKAYVPSNERIDLFENDAKLAIQNWKIHYEHEQSNLQNTDRPEGGVRDIASKIIMKIALETTLLQREKLDVVCSESFKDDICFKESNLGEFIDRGNLSVERDIFILRTGEGAFVGPTPLLVNAADMMQSRYWLLMYWLLSDCENKYPNQSIFQTGMRLIESFEPLRPLMGQDFFSFMKEWEGLVKGYVISDPEDLGYVQLLENQKEEMEGLLEKHDITFDLNSVLPQHGHMKEEIMMFLELVGMVKIFGYPTLDPDEILTQIKKHGSDHPDINMDLIVNGVAISRRDLLMNYYSKHKHYPPLIAIPPEILKFINQNKPIPDKYFHNYKMWSQIVFDKFLEYDYFLDLSELVKDTAVAVNLSSHATMYDKCAYINELNKKPPHKYMKPSKYPTRVIEGFLTEQENSVKLLVDEAERGVYDPEDKIAVECAKEKELNTGSGRAFTKQTYKKRFLQTSMEKNIADQVFKYVPEQSMTDTELMEKHRMVDHNKDLQKDRREIINLDFKKWNLKFRHALVSPFGSIVDELFGFRYLYKNAHLWFVNCHVFSNHRLCPPDYDKNGDPIEGNHYTGLHLGGFEGLMQKLWTFITIGMLKYCLEIESVKGEVMIQGDNIVILVTHPKEDLYKMVFKRNSLLKRIARTFKEIGHELKEMETWASKHLYEYGKINFYKGSRISQGTKKAQKMIPDSNDGLFSISSCQSIINTATEGLAKEDYSAKNAFILNSMLHLNYSRRRKFRIHGKELEYLNFPVDFGGFPTSSYGAHRVRGHDDKVTLWLSFLNFCKTSYPMLHKRLIALWQFAPIAPARNALDRVRMYEDIYCLNVHPLPSVSSTLKKFAESFLTSPSVTNPIIRRLFDPSVSLTLNDVVSKIDKMEPLFLPVAHELLSHSNAGILKSKRDKFTSVKTINDIVRSSIKKSYVELVSINNKLYVKQIHQKLERTTPNIGWNYISRLLCPTAQAMELRMRSWNREFLHLTKPYFVDQYIVEPWDKTNIHERSHSIHISCNPTFSIHRHLLFSTLGPYNMYIGGATKEKLERPTLDISKKTSMAKSLSSLGKIRGYAKICNMPMIQLLTEDLIREKLDPKDSLINMENIDLWTVQVQGGNISHRYFSNRENRSAIYNLVATPCSHIHQDTNNMAEMTAGGHDYHMHFQDAYCRNVAILVEETLLKPLSIRAYSCRPKCYECCTVEVSNPSFDLTEYQPRPRLPSSPEIQALNINPVTLKSIYSSKQIRAMYTFHLATILADHIDTNATNAFGMKHLETKDTKLISTQISVNDVRMLDEKLLLCLSVWMSHHGLAQIGIPNNYTAQFSYDESYCTLTDLLINSGQALHILRFLEGKIPGGHFTPIKKESMSTWLAKNITEWSLFFLPYVEDQLSQIKPVSQELNLETLMSSVQKLRAYREYRRQSKIKTDTDEYHFEFVTRPPKRQSWIRLFSKPNTILSIVALDKHECALVWKQANKSQFYMSPVQSREINVFPSTGKIVYPLVKVFKFVRDRDAHSGKLKLLFSSSISHMTRGLGSISSGFSKFSEIISAIGLWQTLYESSGTALVLAEGSGSVAFMCRSLLPHLKVGYNTLINTGVDNRHNSTATWAPACVMNGVHSNQHFPFQHILASGETDITTDAFRNKLRKISNSTSVVLLTMDAENPNKGSNIEIVRSLCPFIKESEIKVSILKMFMFPLLLMTLRESMCEMNDKFDWFIFKPISSNPCAHEVYLVISLRGLIDPIVVKDFHENMVHYSYLSPDGVGLSRLEFSDYYNISQDILKVQQELQNWTSISIQLQSPWVHVYQESAACSPTCLRMIQTVVATLHDIHTINTEHKTVLSLIRRSGLVQRVEDILYDLVSLVTLRFRDSLTTALTQLDNIELVSERVAQWRERSEVPILRLRERSHWMDKWAYSKFVMMDLTRMGRVKLCSCKRIIHRPLDQDMVWSLLDQMTHLNLIVDQNKRAIMSFLIPPKNEKKNQKKV